MIIRTCARSAAGVPKRAYLRGLLATTTGEWTGVSVPGLPGLAIRHNAVLDGVECEVTVTGFLEEHGKKKIKMPKGVQIINTLS